MFAVDLSKTVSVQKLDIFALVCPPYNSFLLDFSAESPEQDTRFNFENETRQQEQQPYQLIPSSSDSPVHAVTSLSAARDKKLC